jgi:HTH-type transcriptional regulator, sugar sensing transcriptional regulator
MADTTGVAELVALGMTQYEAKGYLALIGRGEATPAEISRLAGIPRQRVYDVLASLAERLVVRQVEGSTQRYRALPPDQVTERLLAVRRRQLDQVAEEANTLVDKLLPQFISGQQRDEPLDYVEVLRDRRHAVERIAELWDKADAEILSFVCPPYIAPPTAAEVSLPKAPVQRAMYELSLLDNPGLLDVITAYARQGEEIRLVTKLPLKLTIVDSRAVAFNMPDPVEGHDLITTLVVHHPMLAETLRLAFDTMWATGNTLDGAMASHQG